MNKCTFKGSVYKKPILRETDKGTKHMKFMVKVPKEYGDGEIFVPVQAWRGLAEANAPKLGEGTMVDVSGSYAAFTYEKDGEKVFGHCFNLKEINIVDGDKEKPLDIDSLDNLF
jgi:single-stranded DNA-binding protein